MLRFEFKNITSSHESAENHKVNVLFYLLSEGQPVLKYNSISGHEMMLTISEMSVYIHQNTAHYISENTTS